MSDKAFEVVYEARLHYEPQEDISEDAARENLREMIHREPSFGSIRIEYPENNDNE
jgi:hypothetical protein